MTMGLAVNTSNPDGGAPPDAGADAPSPNNNPPPASSGPGILDRLGDAAKDIWDDAKDAANKAVEGAKDGLDWAHRNWDKLIQGAECLDEARKWGQTKDGKSNGSIAKTMKECFEAGDAFSKPEEEEFERREKASNPYVDC
jgi:hypothetical protein